MHNYSFDCINIQKLALCFLLFAAPAAALEDYFPLQPGNQWIYRAASAPNDLLHIEVTGTEKIGDRTYSVVEGFPGAPRRLRLTEAGDLMLYDVAASREKIWAAFSKPDREPFDSFIDGCSPKAEIESHRAEYKGPVGEFTNALRVRYLPGICADAGFVQETFLPYAGMLERTIQTIAGPRRYDLIYARLGGVTVISQRELAFALTLDKAVYATGEPVLARIALRHSQPAPLRIVFSSGQTYELIVRRESGETVFQWSADKSFTQALRAVDFPPGEKNWVEPIPALPVGRYIAEAYLATVGPKAYAASVAFEVR
jgi:Intracellular proteinase inhibitor